MGSLRNSLSGLQRWSPEVSLGKSGLPGASVPELGRASLSSGLPSKRWAPLWAWCLACLYRSPALLTPGVLDAFAVMSNSQSWALKAPEARKSRHRQGLLFVPLSVPVLHGPCQSNPGGHQNHCVRHREPRKQTKIFRPGLEQEEPWWLSQARPLLLSLSGAPGSYTTSSTAAGVKGPHCSSPSGPLRFLLSGEGVGVGCLLN